MRKMKGYVKRQKKRKEKKNRSFTFKQKRETEKGEDCNINKKTK